MKDYGATGGRGIYWWKRKDKRLHNMYPYEPNQGKVNEIPIDVFNISYENKETNIKTNKLIDLEMHKWAKAENKGRQITIVQKDWVRPLRNISSITSLQLSMTWGLVNEENPRGFEQKHHDDWESEQEEKKDSVIQNLENPEVEIII